MPPQDALQPSPAESDRLTSWLGRELHQVDWKALAQPGRQSLSRVTTIEFRNRIRDVFGLDLRAGVYLGRDSEGATGFTNDRDNLSFPLFGMQEFLREAERAVDAFMGYGRPQWRTQLELAEVWQQSSDKAATLAADGTAVLAEDDKRPFHLAVTTPHAGKYRIDLAVSLQKDGPPGGLKVLVNGLESGRFIVDHVDVRVHEIVAILPAGFSSLSLVYSPDLKPDFGAIPVPEALEKQVSKLAPLPRLPMPARFAGDQDAEKSFQRFNKTLANYECDRRLARLLVQRGETDYNRNSYLSFRQNNAPFNLAAGKIAVLLDLPQKQLEKQLKQELAFDRADQRNAARDYQKALAIKHPELARTPAGKVRMERLRIASHALEPGEEDPAWVFEESNDASGAMVVVRHFATRAFARSPSPTELSNLLALYDRTSAETANHFEGLRDALIGILLSPEFLLNYSVAQPESTRELDDHVLASRLAAFLWLSIPDDNLRHQAMTGKLGEPGGLNEAIESLVADERFDAFCHTFMEQWLDLENINGLSPTLTTAMRAEPSLLLRQIIREDRSILDLLDAKHSWINQPLAEHYGIQGITGLEMRPVEFSNDRRGGLLGMGGVLSVTSTEQRTSPVARGAWIVETLLGVELPTAPASVPELKPNVQVRTIRAELEQHRAAPQCSGCHNKIDPYGFVLEHYNRFGVWRDFEGLNPVNSSTVLDDGTEVDGLVEFKRYLRDKRSRDFARNFVERMLKFAVGRETQYYDEALIQRIVDQLEDDGWKAKSLIKQVVLSDAFRKQDDMLEVEP